MASRIAIVLLMNITFSTLVSSNHVPSSSPQPKPTCGCSASSSSPPPAPHHRGQSPPPPSPPLSSPPPPPPPPHHSQHPPPPMQPNKPTSCGVDTLKFKACANVTKLVDVSLGPKTKCCTLIKDLVDLEAAVCLCTALKANVLGINLNVPVHLSLVLNACNKDEPKDFQCA